MGGSSQPQGSFQQTNLDPVFAGQLRQAATQGSQMTGAYQQQAGQNAAGVQTEFQQYAPQLQQNFGQFSPAMHTNFAVGPQLDARAQTLLGYADQGRNAQLAALQGQNAQKFAHTPGLAQILNQQAGMQSQLAANPQLFAAAQEQTQRQWQQQGMENQARLQQSQQQAALQQQGNQAQLQNTEARSGLANMGNAALAQRTQMQAQPLMAQQNLLAALSSLGSLFGSQYAGPLSAAHGNVASQDYMQRWYPQAAQNPYAGMSAADLDRKQVLDRLNAASFLG